MNTALRSIYFRTGLRAVIPVLLLAITFSAGAAEPTPEAALAAVKSSITGQSPASRAAVMNLVYHAAAKPPQKLELARRLAELISSGQLRLEHKNFICQLLAVAGSAEEVPALAPLLADAATADSARLALESIPGEEASQALRSAAGKLEGKALAGVLLSLGNRRDTEAVALLAKLASSSDTTVAKAALQALGLVGTKEAATHLLNLEASVPPALRPACLDAQLAGAERLLAQGESLAAAKLFAHLNNPANLVPVRLGGLRGLALAAPDQALPALLDALHSENQELSAGAAALTGLLQGSGGTTRLAAELNQLGPGTAALLIQALGARQDPAALGPVLDQLERPEEPVKRAALEALASLGNATTIDRLIQAAESSGGSISQAARRALERIHGDGVDQRLREIALHGEPSRRATAIKAVVERRQRDAKDTAFACAKDGDPAIRAAALNALPPLASSEDYPRLAGLLAASTTEKESAAALKALEAAGKEMNVTNRVGPLATAMRTATAAGKLGVLQALGGVGGPQALELVLPALQDRDAEIRNTALRTLADWPDESAARELFRLAKTATEPVTRELALRGYYRVAENARQDQAHLLKQGAELATTPAAKRLWLGALGNTGSAAALELALSTLEDTDVAREAAMAAIKIGEALLKENPDMVKAAMARVVKNARNPEDAKAANALARRAEAPVDVLSPPPYGAGVLEARFKALQAQAGTGRLIYYLDCGTQPASGVEGGPSLVQMTGRPWWYAGAGEETSTFRSVAFDGNRLIFALKGLDPQKKYVLGFSWWDYDGNGRVQSLEIKGADGQTRRLLDRQALPSYPQRQQPPMEYRVTLDPAIYPDGKAALSFLPHGGPNAVVSELWLAEADAGAKAGITSRNAFAPRPKAALDLEPPAEGIKVLIVTGIDYPGHPWRQTAPALKARLEQDARMRVRIVEDPEALASPKLQGWDVVIIHFMDWEVPGPGAQARENLRRFVAGGKGLALTHFACGAWDNNEWPEFRNLAGRVWDPKLRGHDPHGTFRVEMAEAEHPITKGLQPFETLDELYTCLAGDAPIHVLAKATSKVDQKGYPMAFVLNYGQGRVFHTVLGHDTRAYVSPGVGELLRRGIAWAAGANPAAKD